jgi:hypothetical protein
LSTKTSVPPSLPLQGINFLDDVILQNNQ